MKVAPPWSLNFYEQEVIRWERLVTEPEASGPQGYEAKDTPWPLAAREGEQMESPLSFQEEHSPVWRDWTPVYKV